MTGGSSGSGDLSSSEQLDPKSLQWSFPGSPLPEASYGHCVVSINDTTILIIGGGKTADGSAKTFFFHHDGTFTVRSTGLGNDRTGIFKQYKLTNFRRQRI